MSNINIIYIDDEIDNTISYYMGEKYIPYIKEEYKSENININYKEYTFSIKNDDEYIKFLNSDNIVNSHIILIDSVLFENNNITHYKGEDIKLIINEYFPSKQVLVISQYQADKMYYTQIKKYDKENPEDNDEINRHYNSYLKQPITNAIKTILEKRNVIKEMKQKKIFNTSLINEIDNSIQNIQTPYKEFNESDLDKLIEIFTQIKDEFNRNE